jgi:hypothetical protein
VSSGHDREVTDVRPELDVGLVIAECIDRSTRRFARRVFIFNAVMTATMLTAVIAAIRLD